MKAGLIGLAVMGHTLILGMDDPAYTGVVCRMEAFLEIGRADNP